MKQKNDITELAKKITHLKNEFVQVQYDDCINNYFPEKSDIRAMAGMIDSINFELPIGRHNWLKQSVKKILYKMCRPLFKMMLHKQIELNEYTWLLANTVYFQDQRIKQLEDHIRKLS